MTRLSMNLLFVALLCMCIHYQYANGLLMHRINLQVQNVATNVRSPVCFSNREARQLNSKKKYTSIYSTAVDSGSVSDSASAVSSYQKKPNALIEALKSNWLILGEVFVIALAHFKPAWGATGGILRPEITISKIGVFTIFFINGVALSLGGTPSELKQATQTNILIQLYNFGFIPILVKLLASFYPDPAFR